MILQHRRKHFRTSLPSSSHWSVNGSILDSYDNYLVAVYKMENGALTTDSKGSNTLTNNNSVASNANGKSGYCGDFNGDNTYLSANTSDLCPTSCLAISWWCYADGATDEQYFFRKASSSTSFFAEYYSTNQALFSIHQSNNTQRYITFSEDFAGGWHHCLMIADGYNLRGYVNGSQVGSISYNGTINSASNPMHIGASHVGVNAFDGRIDEFYFYKDIVIDSGDVGTFASALYNNGTGAFWSP